MAFTLTPSNGISSSDGPAGLLSSSETATKTSGPSEDHQAVSKAFAQQLDSGSLKTSTTERLSQEAAHQEELRQAVSSSAFQGLVHGVKKAHRGPLISGIKSLSRGELQEMRRIVLERDWDAEALRNGRSYLCLAALRGLKEITDVVYFDIAQVLGAIEFCGDMTWPDHSYELDGQSYRLTTPDDSVLQDSSFEVVHLQDPENLDHLQAFLTEARRNTFCDLEQVVQVAKMDDPENEVICVRVLQKRQGFVYSILHDTDRNAQVRMPDGPSALEGLVNATATHPPYAFYSKLQQCFYIPSFSMLQKAMEACPDHLTAIPVYGAIPAYKMRRYRIIKEAHPVLSYNPWVPKNELVKHGRDRGVFLAPLHDIYHWQKVCRIPKAHRTLFYELDQAGQDLYGAVRTVEPGKSVLTTLPTEFVMHHKDFLQRAGLAQDFHMLERPVTQVTQAKRYQVPDKHRVFLDLDCAYCPVHWKREGHPSDKRLLSLNLSRLLVLQTAVGFGPEQRLQVSWGIYRLLCTFPVRRREITAALTDLDFSLLQKRGVEGDSGVYRSIVDGWISKAAEISAEL